MRPLPLLCLCALIGCSSEPPDVPPDAPPATLEDCVALPQVDLYDEACVSAEYIADGSASFEVCPDYCAGLGGSNWRLPDLESDEELATLIPAQPVDSLEVVTCHWPSPDHEPDVFVCEVLAQSGEVCAGAAEPLACLESLEALWFQGFQWSPSDPAGLSSSTGVGLRFSRGDEVGYVRPEHMAGFLGPIDSELELRLRLTTADDGNLHPLGCGQLLFEADDGSGRVIMQRDVESGGGYPGAWGHTQLEIYRRDDARLLGELVETSISWVHCGRPHRSD